MASAFLQLARKVIKDEKRPLTAPEIWEIAQLKGYDRELPTKGKTPWASLGALLYVDVRDNPQSEFITTGSRPKRFVLRSLIENLGSKILDIQTPKTSKKIEYFEKDLHPFLVYYGFYYLKAYLKTIRHSRSDKKEFGEWVHPDVVGCYFPFSDWKEEVVEVSSLMGNSAVKFYSFELKRELSISNLREAFFQAVSNSSWANEGFLVAAEVDNDEDFHSELERLSTAFGIGVIRIDIDDPDSTVILLPAKSKELVDWETVNKLAVINPDFREFLKRVKVDLSSREIRKELYDRVLEKEELVKVLAKKH
ncbi:MAG: HTH domain-containing protein [candidate division KSB1 bacterium]